jgi:hypothetical protein
LQECLAYINGANVSGFVPLATDALQASKVYTNKTNTSQDYKILFTDNLNLDDNSDVYKEQDSTLLYNPGTNRLTVGAISASSGITGSLFGIATSASWAPLNAGGSNTQIQFNSGSALAGTGSFTFNFQSQSLQQGFAVTASGLYSHAEGNFTIASGSYSHAEGNGGISLGNYSHAEGNYTIARGDYSHAEGAYTLSSGSYSHAEGYATDAIGDYSHAEGGNSDNDEDGGTATGIGSHAEGANTLSSGNT